MATRLNVGWYLSTPAASGADGGSGSGGTDARLVSDEKLMEETSKPDSMLGGVLCRGFLRALAARHVHIDAKAMLAHCRVTDVHNAGPEEEERSFLQVAYRLDSLPVSTARAVAGIVQAALNAPTEGNTPSKEASGSRGIPLSNTAPVSRSQGPSSTPAARSDESSSTKSSESPKNDDSPKRFVREESVVPSTAALAGTKTGEGSEKNASGPEVKEPAVPKEATATPSAVDTKGAAAKPRAVEQQPSAVPPPAGKADTRRPKEYRGTFWNPQGPGIVNSTAANGSTTPSFNHTNINVSRAATDSEAAGMTTNVAAVLPQASASSNAAPVPPTTPASKMHAPSTANNNAGVHWAPPRNARHKKLSRVSLMPGRRKKKHARSVGAPSDTFLAPTPNQIGPFANRTVPHGELYHPDKQIYWAHGFPPRDRSYGNYGGLAADNRLNYQQELR